MQRKTKWETARGAAAMEGDDTCPKDFYPDSWPTRVMIEKDFWNEKFFFDTKYF